MERTLTALLTVVFLAGCASSASQQASTVRNGDPATVNRDCKLLGTVSGRSIFGGDETARGEGAIADARAKAAAMGATDIVFLDHRQLGHAQHRPRDRARLPVRPQVGVAVARRFALPLTPALAACGETVRVGGQRRGAQVTGPISADGGGAPFVVKGLTLKPLLRESSLRN